MHRILVLATLCAVSPAALAGLSIERSCVLRNDAGGQISIESTAQLDAEQSERQANATFSDFHPRGGERSINGQLSRSVQREGELRDVRYAGTLSFSATGDQPALSVSLVDVRIRRDEERIDISGQLTINGQTIDASAAPQKLRAALLGLMRLFRSC